MCNNSARSQILFYRVKKVTGQNMKHFGRVRRSSRIFWVQVLGNPTPRGHSEITSGHVLGNDSECTAPTPSLSARGSSRVSRYSGIIPSPNSGYSAQKFRKTKNNFQNIAGPRTPWTKLHSCSRGVGARHLHPNPTRPSSVGRVCARVRNMAIDLTLITIGLEKVSIYTTQTSFAYQMWDQKPKAKWEKLKFSLQN